MAKSDRLKKAEEKLTELEGKFSTGRFEIDPVFEVVKKKGFTCIKGSDLQQYCQDIIDTKWAKLTGTPRPVRRIN